MNRENERLVHRRPKNEVEQVATLRDRVLNTTARIADRYGVLPVVGSIYLKAETAYCLARIAAVGGVWESRVAGETARFGLSTRSEYRRATTLGGERVVLEALIEELSGTETVWDVGACVGTYTCFIADVLTTGHVVGFEPEVMNRSRLRANLETNASAERFTVSSVALSDRNGTAGLCSERIEAGGGHHYLTTGESGRRVETRRGEILVREGHYPAPDVLKIDVQGAELAVLRGLGRTIEGIRSIYLEVHTRKCERYGTTAEAVEAFLRDHGYSLTYLGVPTNRRSGVYFLRASR